MTSRQAKSVATLCLLFTSTFTLSACGQAAPGATNMTDPNRAEDSFIKIVREAKSDDIVQVAITPSTVEVVFREGDRDVYWTDSGEIHEIASQYARPSGVLSASSVSITDMIATSQVEGQCDQGTPKVIAQASFAGETLISIGCYSDDSPWPIVRKVTLGDQTIEDIDLFTTSGINTVLLEAERLLPEGAITSITVSTNSDSEDLITNAAVVGVPITLAGDKECSPTFTRAEKLGDSAGSAWAGIDMYTCSDSSDSIPFKAEMVDASRVEFALNIGTNNLGGSREQVTSWSLQRLKLAKNELVVNVATENGSCLVDLDGRIIR